MSEMQWGVWVLSEKDVDDLVRRAEMGGKEEKQIVTLAEMTISKLPIGCLICETKTSGADAARLGIVKPIGPVILPVCPGFVICRECADAPDFTEQVRATVRAKFGIDAESIAAKKVLQ